MKWLLFVLALVVSINLAGVAQAAENPTGTWKWSTTFGDQTRESTLKLTLADGKLSGAMLGRNDQETAIEDAKFADDTVSFSVTRERNGNRFTTKYVGKVSGDTIKGTTEFERNGETQKRDWEAKRQ